MKPIDTGKLTLIRSIYQSSTVDDGEHHDVFFKAIDSKNYSGVLISHELFHFHYVTFSKFLLDFQEFLLVLLSRS